MSAKSLDSFGYGTVIDNQTIFYDAYELPPKIYEVEFRVAPIPPTQWWAGEICDDQIGVKEFYQNENTEPSEPSTAHVRAPEAPDIVRVRAPGVPDPVVLHAQNVPDGQGSADMDNPNIMPCIAGGKRCGEMCVDLLADPNNCGACARTCPSGDTCENGQCILRIRDKPENKAWYDIFLSIPGTLMSFIQGSPAPDPQTTGSVQTAVSVSVVNIPQGSSNEAQEGSMQVVVLPDRDELRMETIQDSGKIVPDIPPALPEPQVVIIQEHMIAGTVEIPTVTSSPEPRAIIPENYIGSKPQILPIKFTCPAGYITCNGQCVDPMTDTAYCGSCNSTCPSQFTCVAGMCTSQCNSGQTLCNGACASLLTDPNNCGTCGNVCTNGAACESGQCVLPMVKIQTTRLGDIGKVRF